MSQVKEKAIKLIDNLPPNISWDDIIYEMYVKKKIEEGIQAGKNGKLVDHETVKEKFLQK